MRVRQQKTFNQYQSSFLYGKGDVSFVNGPGFVQQKLRRTSHKDCVLVERKEFKAYIL